MRWVGLRCVFAVFPDHTHFLDLSITNGIVSSKYFDKRDDFNFEVVNFPFLDGDFLAPPFIVYSFYQLIRFASACSSNVCDFNNRN